MSAIKFCFAVCLTFLLAANLAAQELKLEEVVSNHTSAIGKTEKRKGLKNMVLIGSSEFSSKLPERKSAGKVVIVSDASNLLFLSSFAADAYPYEKIGYFEGKLNVPFVSPGVRSPLGDFVWEHPSLLKSGLFSGGMSLQWSLLEDNAKKGKQVLGGTKKVDGKKAYVIEYYPPGSSDQFTIRLFFDIETFQHIRSEYLEEYSGKAPAFPGTNRTSSGDLGKMMGYSIQLVETYGDFKTYEEITLPSFYKVHYMGSSNKGTFEYDWTFKINEVQFNQPLKDGFFHF